jgi:hypothetical protein
MVPLVAASLGGWAVVTVEQLPDYLVAGQPATFNFTVRQHGRTLLSDLRGNVQARSGKTDITADARRGTEPGLYQATLTLPEPGEWTVSINSGFNGAGTTLLPIVAVRAGAQPATATLSDAERGKRLFVAKGCYTCHLHRDVNRSSLEVGPELTGTKRSPDVIAQVLAGSRAPAMPDLKLQKSEIAALTSFLMRVAGNQASR